MRQMRRVFMTFAFVCTLFGGVLVRAYGSSLLWLKQGYFSSKAGLLHRVSFNNDTIVIFTVQKEENESILITSTTTGINGLSTYYTFKIANARFREKNVVADNDGNLFLLFDLAQSPAVAGGRSIPFSDRAKQGLLKLNSRCGIKLLKTLSLEIPELKSVAGEKLVLTAKNMPGTTYYYDDAIVKIEKTPVVGSGLLVLGIGAGKGDLFRASAINVVAGDAAVNGETDVYPTNEQPLYIHSATADQSGNLYALVEWQNKTVSERGRPDAIKLNGLLLQPLAQPADGNQKGAGRTSRFWVLKLNDTTTVLHSFVGLLKQEDPGALMGWDPSQQQLNVYLNGLLCYRDKNSTLDWNGLDKNRWATTTTPLSLVISLPLKNGKEKPWFLGGTSTLDINVLALNRLCGFLSGKPAKTGSYVMPAEVYGTLLGEQTRPPLSFAGRPVQVYLGNEQAMQPVTIYHSGRYILFASYGFISRTDNTASDIHGIRYNLSKVIRPDVQESFLPQVIRSEDKTRYYLGALKTP